MDAHILIALLGALLNMLLSLVIPCLLKKSDLPFLVELKRVYETNRQLLLASSVIIAVTIYLALKVYPEMQPMFGNLSGLLSETEEVPSYRYLVKLDRSLV